MFWSKFRANVSKRKFSLTIDTSRNARFIFVFWRKSCVKNLLVSSNFLIWTKRRATNRFFWSNRTVKKRDENVSSRKIFFAFFLSIRNGKLLDSNNFVNWRELFQRKSFLTVFEQFAFKMVRRETKPRKSFPDAELQRSDLVRFSTQIQRSVSPSNIFLVDANFQRTEIT